jgi:hypothetical protein
MSLLVYREQRDFPRWYLVALKITPGSDIFCGDALQYLCTQWQRLVVLRVLRQKNVTTRIEGKAP